ncbi:MAG: hypothetical protein ABI475_06385 [Methylophilaceae bacterium]
MILSGYLIGYWQFAGGARHAKHLGKRICELAEESVTVAHIVLNGKILCPVHANQYGELQTKSRVTSDVYDKEMHTGVVIEDKLIYLGDTQIEKAIDFLLIDMD